MLLHGFASTRRLWDDVIAHLSPERYSPLALDLPGHGEHHDARPPFTFAGCAAHVLESSPERFTLVGYSMGGRVALHVALAAPERVQRLVLVSTTAGIEDAGERSARSDRDRELASWIEAEPIERFVERWRAQPMFERDPPDVDARARREMLGNRPAGVAAALRHLGTGEMSPLWERLGELRTPVTILAGERDAKLLAAAEQMGQLLPDAEARVLSGGHVLPLESPHAVAEAITAGSHR